MFRNDTPSPPAGRTGATDDQKPDEVQARLRQLLQAVAEEPVPERLRSLALALEESLRRRTDPSPPGATDLHKPE